MSVDNEAKSKTSSIDYDDHKNEVSTFFEQYMEAVHAKHSPKYMGTLYTDRGT
eukprot:Ihof_evm20s5 gene=Ihof_evmTU20s5